MLVIKTLKCKISDFLNSNTCFFTVHTETPNFTVALAFRQTVIRKYVRPQSRSTWLKSFPIPFIYVLVSFYMKIWRVAYLYSGSKFHTFLLLISRFLPVRTNLSNQKNSVLLRKEVLFSAASFSSSFVVVVE